VEEPGETVEHSRPLVGVEWQVLQLGGELVDLLVLLLDPQGQGGTVRDESSEQRPQHRLLGEGVGEDESVDASQHWSLGCSRGVVELGQQSAKLDVVAFLPSEHAEVTTQLGHGLGG
jgi:hypothetical protein